METVSRRTFTRGTALGLGVGLGVMGAGTVPALAALAQSAGGGSAALPSNPFTLGVASGDPLPTSVILWTRLAPDPINDGGMPPGDVLVDWEVATDETFTQTVASGQVTATAAYAHAVHVDATGLAPDSWYSYRFHAESYTSAVGRTRTTPATGADVASLRFGFASCQAYTGGYYAAHRHLAAENLDIVFWLGDYIYENGGSDVRAHNGGECFTLADYRNRYGLYKSDPDLQSSHHARPWLVIWDDHEADNNYAGSNHAGGDPSDVFLLRRAAAYQAWWEHQPVRMPAPVGPDLTIYRSLAWGSLASFFALDGRQYRSDQVCGDALVSACDDQLVPDRTMLGAAQETWLFDGLRRSAARWNVLANQTVFAPLPFGGNYNQDQWDGYPIARQRVIDVLAEPSVQNPLVITGDIHAAGIGDVHLSPEDATSPKIATEFVGTSISSRFSDQLAPIAEALARELPWSRYVNAHNQGYTVVELDRARARAEFRVVSDGRDAGATLATDTTFDVVALTKSVPANFPVVTPAFTG